MTSDLDICRAAAVQIRPDPPRSAQIRVPSSKAHIHAAAGEADLSAA